MRTLAKLGILLWFISPIFADNPPLFVTEQDGSPSGVATKLKFSNGTVSKSGTVFSITNAGGGGSMTPGVSYYMIIDPETTQAGAGNISSMTVNGQLQVFGPILIDTPTVGTGNFINRSAFSFNPVSGSPVATLKAWDGASSSGGWLMKNANDDNVVFINQAPQLSGVFQIKKSSDAIVGLKTRYQISATGKHNFNNASEVTMVEFDPVNNSSFTKPIYASSGSVNGQFQAQVYKFADGTTQTTAGGGGTPGGSFGQLQFNSSGTFGGMTNFNYNSLTGKLGVGTSSSTASQTITIAGGASFSYQGSDNFYLQGFKYNWPGSRGPAGSLLTEDGAGNLSFTPSSPGSGGSFLSNNGSGVLTWTTNTTTAGGNSNDVQFNVSGTISGDDNFTYSPSGDPQITMTSLSSGNRILKLQGATSQSGDYLTAYDGSNNLVFAVNNDGGLRIKNVAYIWPASGSAGFLKNDSGNTLTWGGGFSDLSGNIAVSQMNSGSSATNSTFWRGDGTWDTPAVFSPGGSIGDAQYNNSGTFGGVTPAGDGTYTVGLGISQNGAITISHGIVTNVTTAF